MYMKAVFWLGTIVLMQISRSRFKQSKIPLLIPHTTFWAVQQIFGGDLSIFWDNSFSRRIEVGNLEDLMLFFNQNLKLKIARRTPNNCPPTQHAIEGAINCLVVFQIFSFTFKSPLKLLKLHVNSGTPPLKELFPFNLAQKLLHFGRMSYIVRKLTQFGSM